MKVCFAHPVMALALIYATSGLFGGGVEVAAAQSTGIDEVVSANGIAPKLELTPSQRSAIYQEVHKDKSKWRRAGLPPMSAPMCRP
jgi:hypothetical protein